jgi:hypothetical protein
MRIGTRPDDRLDAAGAKDLKRSVMPSRLGLRGAGGDGSGFALEGSSGTGMALKVSSGSGNALT